MITTPGFCLGQHFVFKLHICPHFFPTKGLIHTMVQYKRKKKSGSWKREDYKEANHEFIATERALSLAPSFLADKAKREHDLLHDSDWWTDPSY